MECSEVLYSSMTALIEKHVTRV